MNHAQLSSEIHMLLGRYGHASRDALIPILQHVQNKHGYVSADAIRQIGSHLQLPSSKVYGVATFYNQFRFAPRGKHHIMLCRGTACHVKGSPRLVDTVVRLLRVEPGKTTRDGLFSLEVVACMGACGLAPAISVNGVVHAKVTPRNLERIIDQCRSESLALVEECHVES
jgi:NADH-quinone oxidoreductase subunit E